MARFTKGDVLIVAPHLRGGMDSIEIVYKGYAGKCANNHSYFYDNENNVHPYYGWVKK